MSEDRLAELEHRIASLESRIDTIDQPRRPPEPPPLTAAATGMLRQAKQEDGLGTVGYVGAARMTAGETLWDRQHSLAELLSADLAPMAGILESLGSRPRLTLLTTLVRRGRCTTATLLESLGGEQTSGQLYHHLRALHSAKLITQRRRGEYELAPQAMIQVLTILAAAYDLANDPPLGPPTEPPTPE